MATDTACMTVSTTALESYPRGRFDMLMGATNVDQELAFDRLTLLARRALFYARSTLSEHGGAAIADTHLLLGLLKAAPELEPLIRPTVNVQRLSECLVGGMADRSLRPESEEVPFDPAVMAVLTEAFRLADDFGYQDVTPAHLLLAVLQQPSSAAVECLRSIGVDLTATTEAVATLARGGA